MIDVFKDNGYDKFEIGQAQKWINMTLKYISLFSESGFERLQKVYRFCHIPIDNIILSKLGYDEFKKAWSRVDDYEEYLDFQKYIREICGNQSPLEYEFRLFME